MKYFFLILYGLKGLFISALHTFIFVELVKYIKTCSSFSWHTFFIVLLNKKNKDLILFLHKSLLDVFVYFIFILFILFQF